jgi:predicted amidohydrolase YtcJ
MTTQADLAFSNGHIYTMDASRSRAQAVAIRGGRIIFVGTDAALKSVIGPGTRVMDLHGQMMLPGFQDVHIHPIGGGIEASACDLNGLDSLEAYRDKIAAYARDNPDAQWIQGGGWLMSVFGPGGMPSRRILDELVPDRPVFLYSSDGHTGWANSKALEIAGITRDTPDPRDGRIDRDPATGEAIGSLQEGASALVRKHLPPVTLETRTDGLRYAIDMLNGYGITSIQDANVSEEDLQAYHALDERGELKLRVVGSQWWERDEGLEQIEKFERLRREYNSERLRASTVKIMQDGVMENYTAAMLEPYLQKGDTRQACYGEVGDGLLLYRVAYRVVQERQVPRERVVAIGAILPGQVGHADFGQHVVNGAGRAQVPVAYQALAQIRHPVAIRAEDEKRFVGQQDGALWGGRAQFVHRREAVQTPGHLFESGCHEGCNGADR